LEGLYRVSGYKNLLENLKHKFDHDAEMNLFRAEEGLSAPKDAHLVTGLLKSYLSSLPVPVLTFQLYNEFIKLNGEIISIYIFE
jgi:hypothetical protein